MPYYSRSQKRRARRNYRKSKSMAVIAKKVFNKHVENKYQTFDFTPTLVSTSGTLLNVNVLAQGATGATRIGNRVKFTSVRFKGFWIHSSDTYNVVRMMVLWSRTPLNVANMPSVQNPINPSRQNFKVLYDRTNVLEASTASGLLVSAKPSTVYRKINGNSTYDGTVTTPDAGYLYFYFVSDSGLTPHPSFNGMAIMSYQDA